MHQEIQPAEPGLNFIEQFIQLIDLTDISLDHQRSRAYFADSIRSYLSGRAVPEEVIRNVRSPRAMCQAIARPMPRPEPEISAILSLNGSMGWVGSVFIIGE